jgi:hypothetical protein
MEARGLNPRLTRCAAPCSALGLRTLGFPINPIGNSAGFRPTDLVVVVVDVDVDVDVVAVVDGDGDGDGIPVHVAVAVHVNVNVNDPVERRRNGAGVEGKPGLRTGGRRLGR